MLLMFVILSVTLTVITVCSGRRFTIDQEREKKKATVPLCSLGKIVCNFIGCSNDINLHLNHKYNRSE